MDDLLIERRNAAIFVTLNRPAVLNALNFNMIRGLNAVLDDAAADPGVQAVCITGAGDRAFCAGGDIKAAREGGLAWKAGQGRLEDVMAFFDEEYALNRRMFHFEKPLIAVMSGITMGGGVGIAGACRIRITTATTRWAMPEVTIGFFPDVGAGYYLTRAPGFAGRYLGLTGQAIANAADLLTCGFATHYMDAAKVSDVLEVLASGADTTETLAESPPVDAELPYAEIDRHFSHDRVEDILASLDQGDQWGRETANLIRTKSPTSLKVTLKHLQLSAGDTFEEVSRRDVRLARKFLEGVDLYEGIRAAVVDKDRQPKWNPLRLSDIDADEVASYFRNS